METGIADLRTLYRGQNMGCGHGPDQCHNMGWFLINVEQGIILEDDCVPDESFFTYCA